MRCSLSAVVGCLGISAEGGQQIQGKPRIQPPIFVIVVKTASGMAGARPHAPHLPKPPSFSRQKHPHSGRAASCGSSQSQRWQLALSIRFQETLRRTALKSDWRRARWRIGWTHISRPRTQKQHRCRWNPATEVRARRNLTTTISARTGSVASRRCRTSTKSTVIRGSCAGERKIKHKSNSERKRISGEI